jgi:2,4-diaminopentanoate dehydrogenase
MGSFTRGGIKDVLPFLRAGRNVVTPTLFTLLTPAFAPEEDYEPVMGACLEGGGSFFSTGASPGYCTDYFPMAMLGIVEEIQEVRVQEIADYSTYPVVEVAHSWGFGALPGDPIPLFEGDELVKSWQSVPMDIARRLGVEIEEIRVLTESGITDRDVIASFYTIRAGTIANIRFQVQGLVKGDPFVLLKHVNYCDLDSMPAHWPRANGSGDLAYRTIIMGRPNLTAEITFDHPVAAIRTVNAIPAIVGAAPGVIAGSDVPPLNSGNVRST